MHSARGSDVAEWAEAAADRCQADLLACSDLLAEGDGQRLVALQDELFAVHRALNLLRVEARRLSVCALLR